MVVIKLGGSLLKSGDLLACLDKLEKNYQGRAVVIVPGGGVFADQVRLAQEKLQFDDVTAHAMAILAMQQMALLIKALKTGCVLAHSVRECQALFDLKKMIIWSPDVQELDAAGIAASWNITSDSLAAWLAARLEAGELILVKSLCIDAGLTVKQLHELNVVDHAFGDYIKHASFKIRILDTAGLG